MKEMTLRDMEVLKIQKGDVVIVKPKEGLYVDENVFHSSLANLGEKTGIKFLAADMLEVYVLRKEL